MVSILVRPDSVALMVFLASSISKSSSSFKAGMTRANLLYVSAARVPAPEMISGVRASSMRIESTSSTMAK